MSVGSPRSGERRRSSTRRLLLTLLLAVAWVVGSASPASAHAVLRHTTPHTNSSVDAAPASVQLDFNERVEVSVGAIRVFDSSGQRVDAGKVQHANGSDQSVMVELEPNLPPDIYTSTYRVTSADGHPVSGGFSFTVGSLSVSNRPAPNVADLLARSGAGPVVEGLYGVARGVHYGALLLLIGALAYRFFIRRITGDGDRPGWPRRILGIAACAGVAASASAVLFQGALASGVHLLQALQTQVISGSLSTRSGEVWALRAGLWVLLLVSLLPSGWPSLRRTVLLTIVVAALVASLPVGGHASTIAPTYILIPADVLHVLAAGVWLGGLVLLLVLHWPRKGREPNEHSPETTKRFSALALIAISILLVAGLVQTWFYVGLRRELFTSAYGWALLVKVVLVAGIIGLGAYNRKRTRLLVNETGGFSNLRRAMRLEVALALLVLASTAVLVRVAPPVSLDNGAVIRDLDLGTMRLQLDIEPARVGANDYHLYLFDRRTGAQVDRVEQLTVRLTQPSKGIGPIVLDIPRAGPAHYELRNSPLGVKGKWRAEVTARISQFDEVSAATTFEVRGTS